MNIVESRKLVAIASICLVLPFIYLKILETVGDPRLIDHGLEGEEIKLYEYFIISLAPLSVLVIWVSSIVHAFKNRRVAIGIFTIIIWPLSFVYAWFMARK